ncbi:hypothetical protein D3C76_1750360 [compost metagenome]
MVSGKKTALLADEVQQSASIQPAGRKKGRSLVPALNDYLGKRYVGLLSYHPLFRTDAAIPIVSFV